MVLEFVDVVLGLRADIQNVNGEQAHEAIYPPDDETSDYGIPINPRLFYYYGLVDGTSRRSHPGGNPP